MLTVTGYHVYALLEPRTGKMRYIGCTSDPRDRLRKHCCAQRGSNPRTCWLTTLRKSGLRPIFKTLCVLPDRESGRRVEALLTARYKQLGVRLTNDEIEARLRPASETEKAKLKNAWNDERRVRVSAKLKGRRHTSEAREKIRLSKLGKKRSAEVRAKISATRKAKFATNYYAESYIRNSVGQFTPLKGEN